MRWPTLDATPWLGALSGAELLRKALHLGVGLLAFALADLGLLGSALLLAGLSVFNLWIWPHLGGRRVWREARGRRDVGIALYPTVLLALLLLTRRLDVVAAVWGLLAVGDGSATLVGRAWGGRAPLSWNPRKSWPGLLAHGLLGSLGAAGLLVWTRWRLDPSSLASPEELSPLALWLAAAVAAAWLAAAVESLPLGLDDNLTTPPLAALFLLAALETGPFWVGFDTTLAVSLAQAFVLALGVNLALALTAWRVGSIDVSGVVSGTVLGTVIATALGWSGFTLLLVFFVLGSVATRVGWSTKVARGLAEGNRGRRGAKNALANVSVPAVLACFALTTPHGELFRLAFAAAFAAAAADTSSSELGQIWGRRPRMLTTLRPAEPGVDGAISLEGTLAGIAAAAILALVGAMAGLYGIEPMPIALVVAAGLFGTLFDSLLGATLERRALLDNEAVNFLAILGAAGFAMVAASVAL